MASMETNYHGLHDYSTFSSSTIKHVYHQEGEQHTNFYCFLCRLSELLILHPVGPFRCCWDLFVMLLLIYTSIEIPYTVSFGQSERILYIGLFVDGFLFFDIFLNFHTAYFDKYDNLRLVTNKRYICKKYFRTWFFIDFLTCIPFEFIINAFDDDDDDDVNTASTALLYVKILRIFRLVRIVKILRFVKMLRIFDAFMKQFIIREVIVFMKLFKIIFGMLMFAHFAACVWWFVGSKTSPSWIDAKDLRDNDDLSAFQQYSFAWYWAVVTLFTTGYGDIAATNTEEQWVCSICILIGTCFFAYFVGTLTVLITEGDKIKSYELEKLEEAQSFCEKKKLPKELTRAILTHIRYHCTYNYVFDESELLNILPTYLQHDVHTYVAKQFLMQLNIFQNEYIQLPEFIVGLIAVKCRSISCNESYKLYDVGDFAKTFYIQRTGRSTMYDKNGKILHELSRGSVCGEFSSILFKRRRLLVQCNTWSEFYSINIDDIKEILHLYYPKSALSKWEAIKKYAKFAYKKNIKHSVDINGLYNYEYIEGSQLTQAAAATSNNDGFNAPSLHSLFSFNKNSTNMSHTHALHSAHGSQHIPNEVSIHLFNNTRSRGNSQKTNSEKRTSAHDQSGVHLANIIGAKVSSPIPPQTPITPEPKNINAQPSFDSVPRKRITIVTPNVGSSNEGKTPKKVPQLQQKRSRSRKRTKSVATPSNTAGSATLQRTSTPKVNALSKKFHIRSNSEIRDIVVVNHAQKHQKLSTPKGGALNSSPHSKQVKRISDIFRLANNQSNEVNHTARLRKFVSEPVLFSSNMEMSVIQANNNFNKQLQEEADQLKKTTSLRSGYSSVSLLDDSECSFASIQSESDSESFGEHAKYNNMYTRNDTESKHTESRHSHKEILAKKKTVKKKAVKKKKGKGKFGGRGARSGANGKSARRSAANMHNVDKHHSKSPRYNHHKQHHHKHHHNVSSFDNINVASVVQPTSKTAKMFVYNDRNNMYPHDVYDDDEENDEHMLNKSDIEIVSRQTSFDPAVLLAPLSVKKIKSASDPTVIHHENIQKEYVQNIHNININIGATNLNENVFVMTPEYHHDEDDDDGIIYDDDDDDYDGNNNSNDDAKSIDSEIDEEIPAMMPIIQSNIESL